MDFVRKWALSTNGKDSLSHYFRGVVYLTPTALNSIAETGNTSRAGRKPAHAQ